MQMDSYMQAILEEEQRKLDEHLKQLEAAYGKLDSRYRQMMAFYGYNKRTIRGIISRADVTPSISAKLEQVSELLRAIPLSFLGTDNEKSIFVSAAAFNTASWMGYQSIDFEIEKTLSIHEQVQLYPLYSGPLSYIKDVIKNTNLVRTGGATNSWDALAHGIIEAIQILQCARQARMKKGASIVVFHLFDGEENDSLLSGKSARPGSKKYAKIKVLRILLEYIKQQKLNIIVVPMAVNYEGSEDSLLKFKEDVGLRYLLNADLFDPEQIQEITNFLEASVVDPEAADAMYKQLGTDIVVADKDEELNLD